MRANERVQDVEALFGVGGRYVHASNLLRRPPALEWDFVIAHRLIVGVCEDGRALLDLTDQLRQIPGVEDTETTIVLAPNSTVPCDWLTRRRQDRDAGQTVRTSWVIARRSERRRFFSSK